ncbi:MAG: hypothetical protein AB7H77_10285 [Bdellovibrionales bacterium]
MSGHFRIVFAPALPPGVLEALAAVACLLIVVAIMRHARGALLRAVVFSLLLLALANPSLLQEQREPLKDTALLVVDESASMQLGDRTGQARQAMESLKNRLAGFGDLAIEILSVKGLSETNIFHALDAGLSGLPPERMAGILIVTDGEVHDRPREGAAYPGPVHVLLAGHRNETDRRLVIEPSPAYGIVGKKVTLTLRLEDRAAPQSENAIVTFRRDNGEAADFPMPVGKNIKFDVPVDHAGQNLYVFSTGAIPGELTPANNTAAVTINGIRDRLKVLLISGEPHIGGRTWRNFLKADPAVDLVHFTILRSPNKMDGVPNSELSLIAFPVRELFDTKLNSFDLIIFDRYRQQSLIPDAYLENIARYVEEGGALLISNTTDEDIPALTFSPLARILPAEPTGRLRAGAFVPDLSEAGRRHPVTAELPSDMPRKDWGSWFRQIEARTKKGETLMTGANDAPLLVLDRVGEGRVAQFLSDQFWLWTRGYEGGGPQASLLKRTAHWLVGEPELDETALRARAELTPSGWQLMIAKRSLHDETASIAVTDADGETTHVTLAAGKQPGLLEAARPVAKTGLYRLKENAGDQEILVMAGATDTPEFGAMFATEEKFKPVADNAGGAVAWLEDMPDGPAIKRTVSGGVQHGRGWIGLKQNDQYRITGSRAYPLWPAWGALLILLLAAMAAWRREGQS